MNHNIYCLDFPNRSMTQGWLVFPQKNESLELEGLTAAVDSMLLQVKFDNTLLSNSLARAFDEVGTHRYRTDSTMTDYYHIRQSGVQPILSVLPGIEPAWVCLRNLSHCRTRCPPHWTITCLPMKRSSNG